MYKLTIQRIDPEIQINATTVYLTDEEAKLMQAAGVKCESRDNERFHDSDIRNRPWRAQIPTVDFRRSIESKVYEQVLETLDINKIIKAANGIV